MKTSGTNILHTPGNEAKEPSETTRNSGQFLNRPGACPSLSQALPSALLAPQYSSTLRQKLPWLRGELSCEGWSQFRPESGQKQPLLALTKAAHRELRLTEARASTSYTLTQVNCLLQPPCSNTASCWVKGAGAGRGKSIHLEENSELSLYP